MFGDSKKRKKNTADKKRLLGSVKKCNKEFFYICIYLKAKLIKGVYKERK
jgi:hypothetical protein